jgi:peptide/nickel transport system substrate-binding protein
MCIIETGFDPHMKAGYDKFTSKPSGTGPFMLKDFVPADHATIVRNPHHWQPPYPYVDAIKFTYLPQQTTQIAALQSGEVDFVINLIPTQAVPLIGAPDIKVVSLPATGFLNMRMRSDRPPFSDPRVRSAFKYLVDRKAVNQTVAKGLAPIGNDQPISPAFKEWYTDIGVRPHDPARAQALLAQAGYSAAKPLSVNLYASNYVGQLDFATVFQQSAGDVNNLQVKITSETWETYLAADWLRVDFGVTAWGSRPVPQVFLNLIYRTGGVWNEGHYSNKGLDALIDRAGAELDGQKRKGLYRQIAKMISDDGPSILPTYTVAVFPMRTRVQGFRPLPDTFHYYRDVWLSS